MNKNEEQLFCLTRQIESLKDAKSQIKKDSKEYFLIEKDIAKCEDMIKDITRRMRI